MTSLIVYNSGDKIVLNYVQSVKQISAYVFEIATFSNSPVTHREVASIETKG